MSSKSTTARPRLDPMPENGDPENERDPAKNPGYHFDGCRATFADVPKCTAWLKRKGRRCRAPAVRGSKSQTCRFHGGKQSAIARGRTDLELLTAKSRDVQAIRASGGRIVLEKNSQGHNQIVGVAYD